METEAQEREIIDNLLVRVHFIDNLLARVHLIIEMSRPDLRHASLNSLFANTSVGVARG